MAEPGQAQGHFILPRSDYEIVAISWDGIIAASQWGPRTPAGTTNTSITNMGWQPASYSFTASNASTALTFAADPTNTPDWEAPGRAGASTPKKTRSPWAS